MYEHTLCEQLKLSESILCQYTLRKLNQEYDETTPLYKYSSSFYNDFPCTAAELLVVLVVVVVVAVTVGGGGASMGQGH